LRVVHINLYDMHGGAARIAWNLMDSMTNMGHEINIFAHRTTSEDPRVISIPFIQTCWQKKLLTQERQQGLFDLYSAALWRVIEHPLFEQADIVHLHCINGGYFSFLLLPFLASRPMVWTLHDSLAFTAGCLYTDFCDGWKNDWCSKCPQDAGAVGGGTQRELVQLIKSLIYKVTDFTAVCPSLWLKQQAEQSIMQEHDIRLIYNGVDIHTFKPGNQIELRTKLGLPIDKKIIMFAAHGGLNNSLKGGNYLYEALQNLYAGYPDLFLLTIGTVNNAAFNRLSVPHLDIPYINNQQLLADYYGAADIYVSPTLTEVFGLTVCEAMSCGTPVVAFATGGIVEVVIHQENGYLAECGNIVELARGIGYFLDDVTIRQRAGEAARLRVVQHFSTRRMTDDYITLYEEILKKQNSSGKRCFPTPSQDSIPRVVEKSKNRSWDAVWQDFRNLYQKIDTDQMSQRSIFTDQFFSYCLSCIDPIVESQVLWTIIAKWRGYRQIPERCGGLPPEELAALVDFSSVLRDKLYEYFMMTPRAELINLNSDRQNHLCILCQQVFFNDFLQIQSQADRELNHQKIYDSAIEENEFSKYLRLMLISMYHPLDAGDFPIHATELWNNPILPVYCKVIITLWMINTPYYSIEEGQRQRVLKYASDLCQIDMPTNFFIPVVNEFVKAFWRISYAGGNNLPALSLFGDFIASYMGRFFPRYSASNPFQKEDNTDKKVRVGYISRFFYRQAVSYYMVNRVIHHDKEKFAVYTFALGTGNDEITQEFSRHSEYFRQFTNINVIEDIYAIVQNLVDSQLDVLIYTDIGMDPLTYMLAGLRLAPVQCALVGHGTTSGLPTIDYYISGDFEPFDAEHHYREKLIRLPNLGAAQFPPTFDQIIPITRKDWKIPDEAVVFVSCANGIKHSQSRDELLVDILRKAPNACILLKPCHVSNMDQRLGERIMSAAKNAGVENRLFILPPLGRIDALLAIADIQLDTYPYGGWTTNMEALYMGLPIVTQEGDMARSRWGAHMLKALGIQEGIATNETEYVDWAVRFAQDRELRRQVKNRIIEQVTAVLFNGPGAQKSYEDALLEIIKNMPIKGGKM